MENDADGACDGVSARNDIVRRDAAKIGSGGGRSAEYGSNRLVFREFPQVQIKGFAAGRGAAWTVDCHNNRFYVFILAQLGEQVVTLSAVTDKPADGEPGYVIFASAQKFRRFLVT